MKTLIIKDDIALAARLIKSGELVAVPTETVYGLAGNGMSPAAVEKIYEVKGRPAVKPLALMVHDSSAMKKYCEDVPPQALCLAKRFWPGPLSIVLKAKPTVPEIVRAGGDTVSLRCPDHPLTLELIKKTGLPLAAPSANPSGSESPKTAQCVTEYFDGKIAAVIDGGECGIGTESTVIDMSAVPYKILRKGALSYESIAQALADEITVIGITGGTGCGKTTVLGELKKMGAYVIDCDELYHEMLSYDDELLSDINRCFPGTVNDGVLDRKHLGAYVFSNAEALEDLNAITHRHIQAEVDKRLCACAMRGVTLAAIDAIALMESGLASRCRTVIGITAETVTRMNRIMKRDGIDAQYAMMRINAQQPNAYFEQHCDHILKNDGTEAELIKKFKNLYKEVMKHG